MGKPAEVVAQFRELWNAGKFDQLETLIAPGYVHDVGAWKSGMAEYKAMSLKVRGSMPDYTIRTLNVVEQGEWVATRWVGTGTHQNSYGGEKPTGKTIVVPGMQLYHVVDGKIVEDFESIDNLSILQQIGALPPMQ